MSILKESLVTRHDFAPNSSFIRRKLALQLFQQLNPGATDFGIEEIQVALDQRINVLRSMDKTVANVSREDEVYVECLIRAHFKMEEASTILRGKRPNLVGVLTWTSSVKKEFVLSRNHLLSQLLPEEQ